MVEGVNRAYEDKVKKRYSEFKEIGVGTWNAVNFKGRFVNMYTDEKLIKELYTDKIKQNFEGKKDITILDFGGGDGTLISIIEKQLEREFHIDAYNIDLNDKSLEICKESNPKLNIVKQNLLTPYKKECADVILCRFVMQYQSKEEQLIIIKNAYNSLKKGGLFFVLWPSHTNGPFINNLEAETVHTITGKDKKTAKHSRYFTQRQKMIGNLRKQGFKIIYSNKEDIIQYYSVKGWSDRFNLTKEQETQLTELFNVYSKKYPKLFQKMDGMLTHCSFHYLVVGKK